MHNSVYNFIGSIVRGHSRMLVDRVRARQLFDIQV